MFNAVDVPEAGTRLAPWIRDVAPDVRSNEQDADAQLFVLVLDDANPMAPGDLMRARDVAKSIISRLGPTDMAAVVFVADSRSGQEFTHDPARLLAAVECMGGPPPGGALEMTGPVMTLRTLKGQAEALMDMSTRRKAVVFISTRGAALPDFVTGEGTEAGNAEDREGIDPLGMMNSALGEFGEFLRAAQRANLTVHGLDPGGLRAPQVSAPMSGTRGGATTVMDPHPNRTGVESLQTLSVNTGGFAIVSTNDPQPGIAQVFREFHSYYLLAYASSSPHVPGRFRAVRVRVNRPDAVVRTKSGYFEQRDGELKKAAAAGMSASVAAASTPKPDMPMLLASAPFASAGKSEAAVAVTVRLQQPGPASGDRLSAATVMVTAYDYLGKPRASERLSARITRRAGSEADLDYQVLSRLDLKPGRYQLRVSAVEDVGSSATAGGKLSRTPRSASVYGDLDVPDFARAPLSMSGMVLDVRPTVRSAGTNKLAGLIPVMPTAERALLPSDRALAFLRLYQGGKAANGAVTIHTRILDAGNVVMLDRTEELPAARFSDARSVDCQVELPLARLQHGACLLTIESARGQHAGNRDLRFWVR